MKYKLIKEYPGSPTLGTIVDHDYSNDKYGFCVWRTEQTDSWKEFWEKVEEIPDYVECLYNKGTLGDKLEVGKIYKVKALIEKKLYLENFSRNPIYKGLDDIETIDFPNNFSGFKPSTKEAYDKQELLTEAKCRYKIGDVIDQKKAYDGHGKIYKITNLNILIHKNTSNNGFNVVIDGYGVYNTDQDKWAEVVKPIFTTEDGVDIFEGDTYHQVYKHDLTLFEDSKFADKSSGKNTSICYYFSTKEAAKKWIDENKPKEKTLKDYEDVLLAYSQIWQTWKSLKEKEPHLYWSKILRIIADDLNDQPINQAIDRWFIYWNYDYDEYRISSHSILLYAELTYFTSKNNAEKAIEILGNKLNLIFK